MDKEDFFDVCELAGIDARVIREFSKRLKNNETEAQLLVINFRDTFYKRAKKPVGEPNDKP